MSDTPRTLDKQEAIRHLIHAAIRMFSDEEDPFPIHVLAHAAENTLIDVAKTCGQDLRVDWEHYIKEEYHGAFFKRYRAIYNYFKHADRDFDTDIPIRDIMTLNLMTIFICIHNYATIFGAWTNHMLRFNAFVLVLRPELVGDNFPRKEEFLKSIHGIQNMTAP